MRKNIFIMIFASVISILSISNVKALNSPTISNGFVFPNTYDINNLTDIVYEHVHFFQEQCWHTNSGTSEVYCYIGNSGFDSLLTWNNGNYQNTYNTDGFTSSNYNWYWTQNSTYYLSYAIYKWDNVNYTWLPICENYTNTCSNNYITANGNQFPIVFMSFGTNVHMNMPRFKTDIWYTKSEWEAPYLNLVNPRPVYTAELIIDEIDNGNQLNKFLNITLHDPYNDMGTGKVQYSYDNNDWYDTTLQSNDDTYDLPVYTNGTYYFRIINSNDTVIYSDTFIVSDLPTITGYSIYTVPKGNHNIYISNFSASTGTIYIPPGYGNLTDSFIYLDLNGDITGIQEIYYNSYEENIWIPMVPMSRPWSTLIGIEYNFTDYANTKVLSFNFNNDNDLVLYIPNGLYLDYVDLSNIDNYDCGSNTNISNTVTLHDCYVEYKYKDNGTISNKSDKSNNRLDLDGYQDGNLSSQDYFSDIKKVVDYNKPVILGVTQDFTNFFNHLSTPIKMSFFFCFGVVFIVLICKSFKF